MQTPLTAIVTLKPENKQAAVDFGIALNAMGDENPVNVALKASNIVHFGRFVFLSEGSQVAIITEFDGSFEDYTNEFVDLLGDVFNSLLALAIDPPPLPVQEHRAEFFEYISSHNVPVILPFFSAYPDLTVLDIQAQAAKSG